jgi:uncharacterized membrane protein YfcA
MSDTVNASFEAVGGFMILLSILKLHKDKQVHGIHYLQVMFFTSWGYWNLYYYFSLQQYASWLCGISVCLANTVWLGMIMYYLRKTS